MQFGLFGARTVSMHAALGCLVRPLLLFMQLGLFDVRTVSMHAALGCLVRPLAVFMQLWAVWCAH